MIALKVKVDFCSSTAVPLDMTHDVVAQRLLLLLLLQFCTVFLTASKLARSGPTSDIVVVVGNLTFETFKLLCIAL